MHVEADGDNHRDVSGSKSVVRLIPLGARNTIGRINDERPASLRIAGIPSTIRELDFHSCKVRRIF
jgi:hypothetical protein